MASDYFSRRRQAIDSVYFFLSAQNPAAENVHHFGGCSVPPVVVVTDPE